MILVARVTGRRTLQLALAALLMIRGSAEAISQEPTRRPDQVLWTSEPSDLALVGYGMASYEDLVLIAARTRDLGPTRDVGSVSIYRRTGSTLEFLAERFTGSEQSAVSAARVDARDGILAVTSPTSLPSGPPHVKGQCAIFDLDDPTFPQIGSIRPDARVLGPGNGALGGRVVVLDRDHVALSNAGFRPPPLSNGMQVPNGAVFVYQRGPTDWTLKQAILPGRDFFGFPDPAPGHIGNNNARGMDFDGERLVVGARDSFSIYEWGTDQVLHPVKAVEGHPQHGGSRFGFVVAIQGDLVAVGSWRPLNSPYLARVHVYRESAAGWSREATLLPSDGFATVNSTGSWSNSTFGYALEIDERGRILVGATTGQRTEHANPPFDERPGTAYLFEKGPGGWEQTQRFWDAEDQHQAEHGHALAFAGDMVVTGAIRARLTNSIRQIGNANVYLVPFGETVCSGSPNSTGSTATLEVVGDRDVAYESLGVCGIGLPPAAPAMLIASRQSSFVPNPGASAGNLCLGGSIARFVGSVDLADAAGRVEFPVPGLVVPTPGGPESIEAGDSWTFQVWYRDDDPTPTSNFTAATRVEFD